MPIVNSRGSITETDRSPAYYLTWRAEGTDMIVFKLRSVEAGYIGTERLNPLQEVTAEIVKHALRGCLLCTPYLEPLMLAIVEAFDPKIDEWFQKQSNEGASGKQEEKTSKS